MCIRDRSHPQKVVLAHLKRAQPRLAAGRSLCVVGLLVWFENVCRLKGSLSLWGVVEQSSWAPASFIRTEVTEMWEGWRVCTPKIVKIRQAKGFGCRIRYTCLHSLDITPIWFFFFRHVKKSLRGFKFHNVEETKTNCQKMALTSRQRILFYWHESPLELWKKLFGC